MQKNIHLSLLAISRFFFVSSLLTIATCLVMIIASTMVGATESLVTLSKTLVIQSYVAPFSYALMKGLEDKEDY